MVHQARDLSPEQKAAAELLLGRRLEAEESISVQTFDSAPVSEDTRREVSSALKQLFDEIDANLPAVPENEVEELFNEAMRSSRSQYRSRS